jgi:hypothetical protein
MTTTSARFHITLKISERPPLCGYVDKIILAPTGELHRFQTTHLAAADLALTSHHHLSLVLRQIRNTHSSRVFD